jgi:uncharacterized protein
MSRQNVDLVREALDAFNGCDIDRLLEHIHPNLEFVSHLAGGEGGVYQGPPGLRRYFVDLERQWSEIVRLPEEFIDAGDSVVAVYRVRALGRVSGVKLDQRFATVFIVHSGKIGGIQTYRDRRQALEAAGLAG